MNAITRPEHLAPQTHDEENGNPSRNPSLNDVIEARMSRRGVFKAGFGTAGTAVLGSFGLAACGGGGATIAELAPPALATSLASLAFKAVPKNRLDTVTIAEGYTAKPLYAHADPDLHQGRRQHPDGPDPAGRQPHG